MEILFFKEDVAFGWDQEEAIREWVVNTIHEELEGIQIGEISVIFCSDNYLLDINLRYLDHDYFTDIITFQYSKSPLSADLYISIDRVKENADQMKINFYNELYRVIIHGILHTCGHPDGTDREKTSIRAKEDHYLNHLFRNPDMKFKCGFYSNP